MIEKKSQFLRVDDFNPAVDCSDPILRKWIHKQVVKKTGSGEDDFIIEEKPVLVEEVNIQKSIDEESKTTDLKYLLKQLMLTGDESILNKKQGFYGDITAYQTAIEDHSGMVTPEVITLPQELKSLTIDELASLSDKQIAEYIAKVRSKKEAPVEASTEKKEEVK